MDSGLLKVDFYNYLINNIDTNELGKFSTGSLKKIYFYYSVNIGNACSVISRLFFNFVSVFIIKKNIIINNQLKTSLLI